MSVYDDVRFWMNDDTLPNSTVQKFLDKEKMTDKNGCEPGESGWIPTYSVSRAAGWGWIWKAGQVENKSVHYRVGDISVTVDKNYCLSRARELMGSGSEIALRRDEK